MKKAKKAPKGKPHAKAMKDDELKNVSGGLIAQYDKLESGLNTFKLDSSPNLFKLDDVALIMR